MRAGTMADDYRAWVSGPEQALSLAKGALLFAATVYDDLDIGVYVQKIDEFADAAYTIAAPDSSMLQRANALNHVLFEQMAFQGNRGEYSDPRNSFLNDVIDRKLGIPISLCVLYLEVGWKIGLDITGISFPGHFLVRLQLNHAAIVIDPFHQGKVLDRQLLLTHLKSLGSSPKQAESLLKQALRGATKKQILARMLRNLKQNYLQNGQVECALIAADLIVSSLPDEPLCLRERAELYENLEVQALAADDYEAYLHLAPNTPDAESIRQRLVNLREHKITLN